MVALTKERSFRVLSKLPKNLEDPSSFTHPIHISEGDVGQALCDFWASINIMPLLVFKTLSLEEYRPINITLLLATLLCVARNGIVEDIIRIMGKYSC